MTLATKTLLEQKWESKDFFYHFVSGSIAAATTLSILMKIDVSRDYVLKAIDVISSGASGLTWKFFADSTYDLGTGVDVPYYPGNTTDSNSPSISMELNPTSIVPGPPLNPVERQLLAQEFGGPRYFIDSFIVAGSSNNNIVTLQKGRIFQLDIINVDPTNAANVDLSINGWNK